MRKIINAALAALFVLLCATPALAADRQIAYPLQNPTSEQFNAQARAARMALGTALRDFLGSSLSAGGVYTNLTVAPNGGMYVDVAPTTTGTPGAVYQLAQDDPNPLPQGFYTPQLSADTTLTIVPALQSGPSSSIGPLSAPAGGTSQYYLIEAQVQTSDTTPLPMTFLNSQGTPSTLTVNTVRHDGAVFQAKAGTPASSSPAVPTVDSGWVAIANILIPGGASSITSGMITAYPAFQGFVVNGSSVSVSALTISSLATAGCLQNSNTGVISSQPCTSGLGTVNGTSPIVSSTTSGVATVSCPNCASGVSASSPLSASISSNLLSISLTGTVPFANLPTIPTASCIGFSGTAFTSGTCLTGLTAGTGIAVGSGATPSVGLSHGDYVDLSSTQTVAGVKTFSSAPVSSNGFTAGSSTYGPTSASVNGALTATTASFGSTLGNATIVADGEVYSKWAFRMAGATHDWQYTVGPSDALQFRYNSIAELASDVSGNITANSYAAGSSTYGPTGATINGTFTTTGTGTNIIDGNGTTTPAFSIGSAGSNTWAFQIGSGVAVGDFSDIGAASGALVAGIYGQALYIDWNDLTNLVALDNSGDLGIAGNFFAASSRALKRNISPLPFDPLKMIEQTTWDQWCYKANKACNIHTPGDATFGYVAEDTSAYLAGPKHDRTSAQNLAAIDAAAIKELDARVRILYALMAALGVWCLGLTIVVLRRA